MNLNNIPAFSNDDQEILTVRRDLSGGINTGTHGAIIGENEATNLQNVDIGTPGQCLLRKGNSLVATLATYPSLGVFGFNPDGGTEQLIVTTGNNIYSYDGTNTTLRSTVLSLPTLSYMTKIGEDGEGDVVVIQDGFGYPARLSQSYGLQYLSNASLSAPKSIANVYFRNRWFVLKSNNLYWSDAYSADYSIAFDQNNDFYRIPCGTERALIGLRDEGILCFGEDSVWAINPSVVPAATDLAAKIVDFGCVAPKSVVQVGDEVFYLSRDGVRGLFRSQQDKLQSKTSYPLSWKLKDQVDLINWSKVSGATAVYFDNKYLLAVPKDTTAYNNEVWVYYPLTEGWVVWTGWNVRDWAKIRVAGKEKLFYIDSVNGKLFEALSSSSYLDDGTTIHYVEESRKEDIGQPMVTKSGGEAYVKFLATGDSTVTISADFDDAGYNVLGTVNLLGNGLTFPLTFPVTFKDPNVIVEKFPIDSYGEWRTARVKVERNVASDAVAIKCLERGVVTFQDQFIPEEN